MLAGYILLVIAVTVLTRTVSAALRYKLQFFWSYAEWDKQRDQVLSNIYMFILIGFLAGAEFGRKGIPVAAGFSAMIEITQLVTCRGLFEFNDIVHNTLDAAVGFGAFILLKTLLRKTTVKA